MKKVNIYKSQSVVEPKVESISLLIDKELKCDSVKDNQIIFESQGKLLDNILAETLPGGTYDQLFICMMKRKASQYVLNIKGGK